MEFSRVGIAFRVRRESGREGAVEVRAADGFELVGEFDGRVARLDDREDATGVTDDVGVGDAATQEGLRTCHGFFTPDAHHIVVAHVTVAVPLSTAVTQAKAVYHACPQEPVMAGGIGLDRIRTDAQQSASQIVGDLAGDREAEAGDLFLDGSEVPGQVWVVGHIRSPLDPASCSVGLSAWTILSADAS